MTKLNNIDELNQYLNGERDALATASSSAGSSVFDRVMPVIAFLLGDDAAASLANPCDYWLKAKPIVLFITTNPLAKAFLPAKLISFLTTWSPVIDGMCPAPVPE